MTARPARLRPIGVPAQGAILDRIAQSPHLGRGHRVAGLVQQFLLALKRQTRFLEIDRRFQQVQRRGLFAQTGPKADLANPSGKVAMAADDDGHIARLTCG